MKRASFTQLNESLWTYEPPPKKMRFVFLPTALIGGAGTFGFSFGIIQDLRHDPTLGTLGLVAALLGCIFMLIMGCAVLWYRARLDIDLKSREVIVHQRTLGWSRRGTYPLDEFDHVEIMTVHRTHEAPIGYRMVELNGPDRKPNLHIRSEHGQAAVDLAEELAQIVNLPIIDDSAPPSTP